jgi:hypothetical protein
MRIGRRGRLTPEQVLSSRPVQNQSLTTEEMEDGGLRIVGQRSESTWIRLVAALFPIPRERKIELDSVGRQVWELCDGEHTFREMIGVFQQHHKLTRAEAEWSLRNYLRELGKRGLVGFAVEKQLVLRSEGASLLRRVAKEDEREPQPGKSA